MPRGRPPGSRNKTPRATRVDTDRRLVDGVRGLVGRVAELEAENARLRQLLDEISRSLRAPAATAPAAGATERRRGRPRKNPEAPVRRRRKITDPEVLEKRRNALAKARAVRAERLAAARG